MYLGTRISSAIGHTVHFHKAPAESDSHLVQAPIATSRGLLSYFSYFLQALRPKNPSGQALVLAILGCLACRATETLSGGEQCVLLFSGGQGQCAVGHNAGVSGFVDMMRKLTRHPQQLQRFADVWQELQDGHILNGHWSDSSHRLQDILTFFCCFVRHERANGKYHYGPHTRSLIDSAIADLTTWLGDRIDHYTMTTYHALHPAVLRNPPVSSDELASGASVSAPCGSAPQLPPQATIFARILEEDRLEAERILEKDRLEAEHGILRLKHAGRVSGV